MDLRTALAYLDPDREDDWTADGLPRIDALAERMGSKPARAEIMAIAPELTRDTIDAVRPMLASPAHARSVNQAAPPAPPVAAPAMPQAAPVGDYQEQEPAPIPRRQVGAHANVTDDDLSIQAHREAGGHNPTGQLHANAAPREDGIDFAILNAPLPVVLNDHDLLLAAIDAMSAKQVEAVKRKSEVQEELDQWNGKLEIAKRALVNLERKDPQAKRRGRNTEHIRRYLETVRQTNMQRAGRLSKFLDAGVKPEEVAAELQGVPANRPRPRQRAAGATN